MSRVLLAIVGIPMVVLLFREILRQLTAGKALARNRFVYATRENNPMLYWSSIMLQIAVALFVFCVILIAVFSDTIHWPETLS
jgi:hypothetical protein